MSLFSSTYDVIVLALLGAIVLLLLLIVPVLYVILRKCGVIRIGAVPATMTRGSNTTRIAAPLTSVQSQRTQTQVTGQDITQLQRAKPSLDTYRGKQPIPITSITATNNLSADRK